MFGPRPAPPPKKVEVSAPEAQPSMLPSSPRSGASDITAAGSSARTHEAASISELEQEEEEDDSVSQYISAPPPFKDLEAIRSPIWRSLPPPPPPPATFSSSDVGERKNTHDSDTVPPPPVPASSRPNRTSLPPHRLPPVLPPPPPQPPATAAAYDADDEKLRPQDDDYDRATSGPGRQTPPTGPVLVTGPSPRTSDEIVENVSQKRTPSELAALTPPSSEVMADTDTGAFAALNTRSPWSSF